jgi:RNA polymerase sigma-70 factor (ECF subfamily)
MTLDTFGTLVGELIPRLRRYARALAREPSRADDLVQDTLERAWSRRALWTPGTDLRAWLFTVMHNLHLNQARRHQVTDEADELHDEALAAPNTLGGEGLVTLRDLERALARLPVEYREVLVLVGVEGLRYQEIADVLGIPIGTVMSRLSRGRERLRTLLQGQDTAPIRRVK